MIRENSNASATKQDTAPETPENVIIDYGHGCVFDAAHQSAIDVEQALEPIFVYGKFVK